MMILDTAKKKPSMMFQIDLEARGQSQYQIRITIVVEDLAWGQAEIPYLEIHKVVS